MYGCQEGKGGGVNWENGTDIYTLLCVKQITNKNLLYSIGNSRLWGNLNRKEICKRGDIYVCVADSLCCKAETSTMF